MDMGNRQTILSQELLVVILGLKRQGDIPMLAKRKYKLEFFIIKNLRFAKSTVKKIEIRAWEKILANTKHCCPEFINYFEN